MTAGPGALFTTFLAGWLRFTLLVVGPAVAATVVTRDWLPSGPVTIGITAGASTPNRVIGDAMQRIAEARGLTLE